MKIIGYFVRIRADQGSFHSVDGAIESVKWYFAELVWMGALQEGAKDFVVKPFREGRVLDTVQKLLGNKNLDPKF